MSTVEFRKVTRIYPQMDHPAVDGFDLDIADGELLVLVGPSGCGKSTVLRMLAGLEPVDAGRILIGGDDVTDVPSRERDIAMVFQAYALYPHMTVSANIAFHLLLEGDPPAEIRRRVDDVAELLGITELLHLKPSKLSGGQRQRVAMGRALIRRPQVFLMDEPLSNLDAKLRIHMRTEIATLQKRLGTTTMYVTHDQTEAMTLGDRVAVQDNGVVLQCAPPMELYDEPVDEFVAGFIGSPAMNLLPARVCNGVAVADGIEHRLSRRQIAELSTDHVTIGVRPEAWTLGECGGLRATVDVVEVLGADAIVYLSSPGIDRLSARLGRGEVTRGQQVHLVPRAGEVHVFDTATTKRIPA
ncbi:MAG: ABC transporter ATP-binding protein [Ilumatobacter sp.]|uniref:ABC transporter ATP-binding protein n=1 Tax=Ilumatobacter sp. TaxID=1967498 RepID=UPI003299C127